MVAVVCGAASGSAARPAGEVVGFVAGDGDHPDAVWAALSPLRRLFAGSVAAFSPNRRRVVVERGLGSFVVRVDGTRTRRLPGHIFGGWSPNGQLLAVKDSAGNLVVTNPDGLSARRVGGGMGYTATWTGDSRRLIHVVETRTAGVYAATANTAHVRPLVVEGGVVVSEPEWSADGRRLVYVGASAGADPRNTDLYFADADGSNARRLTTTGSARRPAWSPDGREIAFDSGGEREIYVVAAAGGAPRQLTASLRDDLGPTWSPDGARIAFTTARFGLAEVVTVRSDGTDLVRVTADEFDNRRPDWSSDGSSIAYLSNETVTVVRPDGSSRRELGQVGSLFSGVDWSPAASEIVFTSDGVVNVVAAATGASRVVYDGPGVAEAATWRSDGTIAFTIPHGDDLQMVDVATGVRTPLTESFETERSPRRSPRAAGYAFLADARGAPGTIVLREAGVPERRFAVGASAFLWPGNGEFIWYVAGGRVHRLRLDDGADATFAPTNVDGIVASPRAGRAAYRIADENREGIEIGVIDERGRVRSVARSGGGYVSFPEWSSDGQRLAYIRNTESPYDTVHVYDMRTGRTTRVARGPRNVTAWDVFWLPRAALRR